MLTFGNLYSVVLVRCTMFNVQCKMYILHYGIRNAWHLGTYTAWKMYTVQCSMYDVHIALWDYKKCSTFGNLYSVVLVRCTLYNVQCMMYNVRCLMYNVHIAFWDKKCLTLRSAWVDLNLVGTTHLAIKSIKDSLTIPFLNFNMGSLECGTTHLVEQVHQRLFDNSILIKTLIIWSKSMNNSLTIWNLNTF